MQIGLGLSLTLPRGGGIPFVPPVAPTPVAPPPVSALSAYTRDATNNWPLYQKAQNTQRTPASMTKMATAVLLLRQGVDMDSLVTVTAADVAITGTTAQILANDIISYRDLLYGLLLPSGNDAALCIARLVGTLMFVAAGSTGNTGVVRFVEAMNALCTELAMTNTVFVSPHGLNAGDKSTCFDMSYLVEEYGKQALISTVALTAQRTITITGVNARTYAVSNTNQMLDDQGMIAGKTGSVTAAASFDGVDVSTLALYYTAPNGNKIASVVMRVPTFTNTGDRFLDQRAILYELVDDFPYLDDGLGVGTDAQFANVKFLAGFNSGFTDESSVARALTATGTPDRSTVDPIFGTHSVIFDGVDDRVEAADANDLSPNAGDFCAELWIRGIADLAANVVFISKYETTLNQREWTMQTGSSQITGIVSLNGTTFVTAVYGFATALITSAVFYNGAKRHLCIRRDGGEFSVYVNGVKGSVQQALAASAIFAGSGKLMLGARHNASTGAEFFANFKGDEARLTIGNRRYTGAKFNPSLKPFPRA